MKMPHFEQETKKLKFSHLMIFKNEYLYELIN